MALIDTVKGWFKKDPDGTRWVQYHKLALYLEPREAELNQMALDTDSQTNMAKLKARADEVRQFRAFIESASEGE